MGTHLIFMDEYDVVDLDKCRVTALGNDGAKMLSKAHMPKLHEIALCNLFKFIKRGATSKGRGCFT